MTERAIATPFDSTEIIDIAVNQFRKRLESLSPLQGNKEYGAFEIDYSHVIRLRRMAESETSDTKTLAWGRVMQGDMKTEGEVITETVVLDAFQSKSPNDERMANDLPLTIETNDGKGGRVRRKQKVKDDGR